MKIRVVLAMIALLVLSMACGKEETPKVTAAPEQGKVAIADKDQKVEVTKTDQGEVQEMEFTTKDGKAIVKMGDQKIPDDLGVPLYPDTQQQEGGTWSLSGTGKGEAKGFFSTMLLSTDPFDTVAAFYKEKLQAKNPQMQEMNMPNMKMVSFSMEKADATTRVIVTENKEKQGTNIQITKIEK